MKLTDCNAWRTLEAHYKVVKDISLKQLIAATPDRFSIFSIEANNLLIDYSKNWITEETIHLLCALARERNLSPAIQALAAGENVNTSENRAAGHMALRSTEKTEKATLAQIELQKIKNLSEQLARGELLGFSGKKIDTILHIGMGGSGLGQILYYQALKSTKDSARCYFLTNYDDVEIQETLADCDPEKSIVVVVSKSFSTRETVLIFEKAKHWLSQTVKNTAIQCYAVTEETACAQAQGFLPQHIFKLWDWVGGRYSIWSAASLSVILALGFEKFSAFLRGAETMDQHFLTTPFEKNAPVIMGLLGVWYNNFFHAHTKATIPYSAQLKSLPKYLQQLAMESLGKTVNVRGETIEYATGRVVWGDVGPASQHSFHQLLMQGNHLIPVDFILPLSDNNTDNLERSAFCLSQSQTLLQGFQSTSEKTIPGNRPSTTILMRRLTPDTLGALIACYEHSVFVQSVIWEINAFDQWGVERGKVVAEQIMQALKAREQRDEFDASTNGLLKKIIERMSH